MRYLRNISVTGSLCPSSSYLAQAMYDVAKRANATCAELVFAGVGNGVIAERFLHWNQAAIFVDIDPFFCDQFVPTLRRCDHRVVCADAVEVLAKPPSSPARVVISCLPMHGPFFSPKMLQALANEVHRGSHVFFYSYFPRLKWGRTASVLSTARVVVRHECSVLRNVPPAFVYSLKGIDA